MSREVVGSKDDTDGDSILTVRKSSSVPVRKWPFLLVFANFKLENRLSFLTLVGGRAKRRSIIWRDYNMINKSSFENIGQMKISDDSTLV